MVTNNVSCPAGGKLINSSLNRYEWCLAVNTFGKMGQLIVNSPFELVLVALFSTETVALPTGVFPLFRTVPRTTTSWAIDFDHTSRIHQNTICRRVFTIITINQSVACKHN